MTTFEVLKAALASMGTTPRVLDKAFRGISDLHDLDPAVSVDAFFEAIQGEDPNDPLAVLFHQYLAVWDYVPEPEWSTATGRNTAERRRAIYDSLGIGENHRLLCDSKFPYAPALDAPSVITDNGTSSWKPWYNLERQSSRCYYWSSYFSYLRDQKRWEAKNLAVLGETSLDVVQRLADPENPSPYQSKGLVVGFVQSGKTANFTGVIARAADAGYRLIVVLAGTINILRDQTQRRLDKELVGIEMCSDEHYELDADIDEFLRHGGFPSDQGAFDWERLTGSKEDFKSLGKGISALEFRKHAPSKPLFDPINLHRERARLLVIKKNTTILDKLLVDLEKVSERLDLSEVPTLIIDDESDQASINTLAGQPQDTSEKDRIARSKTNRRIVRLLGRLPRAQYVGYTATPFASVFIDPRDAEDLFPSDFIVGLPKPEGYMGVKEFYDDSEPEPDDYKSNQNAFVRFVSGTDETLTNLPGAIDAFVLAGALKLYREKQSGGQLRFKHHTMLIHNSPRVYVHATQAKQVGDLLTSANYLGAGAGLARLETLWEKDYALVCAVRSESFPVPGKFRDLLPYIGECCRRIEDGPKPVLIINGNNRDDSPNFEKTGVWKILIGGTKLSRGYTVEGLTISYYRRKAQTADTLMQMGRWFGFRNGYKDLVRLYIGDREPDGKNGYIDLYEAFRATCLDEEEFRAQLARYGSVDPAKRITPKQVPPLVPQHLLPPTAKNKMFNARITYKNLKKETREVTVAPATPEARERNLGRLKVMLKDTELERMSIVSDALDNHSFPAIVGDVSSDRMKVFLREYEWLGSKKVLADVSDFLDGIGDNDPGIDNWMFLAPQSQRKCFGEPLEINGETFAVRERARIEPGGRYKVYSEPQHLIMAKVFAGLEKARVENEGATYIKKRQGVFLFYPVRSKEELQSIPTVGFVLVFPDNANPRQIAYSVRDSTQSDAVVVSTA